MKKSPYEIMPVATIVLAVGLAVAIFLVAHINL